MKGKSFMYKLYYSPAACSMAVHVMLNELNVPFELIETSIQAGNTKTPEFIKMNPRGQVPVLVDSGEPIREGGAIITYLLDKHTSPLLPKSGIERAKALEWLMWGNATLHPAYSRFFWLSKNVSDKAVVDAVSKPMLASIQALWDEAEARLAKTPFLAGNDVTAGDILLTVIANWNSWMPQPMTYGANVTRVLKAVAARPAYQKALATEKVEFKAAA
jgi:glutathione S-transferase